MRVRTRVERLIAAPRAAVFDAAVAPGAVAEFFEGFGPVPRALASRMEDGGDNRAGGVRLVDNADGSTIREEIDELIRPERQSYRLVAGFAGPVKAMVRAGGGAWSFTEVARGTRVEWRFYFELRSVLWWPVAVVIMKVFMRGAMSRALRNIAARFSED